VTTEPSTQCAPEAVSPGLKQLQHEADHSPPSSFKTENEWNYTFTTQYAFIAWTGTTLHNL